LNEIYCTYHVPFEIILLTYKILNTTHPPYLYDLVSIQPPHGHNTRSSPYVTLIKPPSSLKVTHRSFRHASPHLWNQLPTSLRIPHPNYSSSSQRPLFEHAVRYTNLPIVDIDTVSLLLDAVAGEIPEWKRKSCAGQLQSGTTVDSNTGSRNRAGFQSATSGNSVFESPARCRHSRNAGRRQECAQYLCAGRNEHLGVVWYERHFSMVSRNYYYYYRLFRHKASMKH